MILQTTSSNATGPPIPAATSVQQEYDGAELGEFEGDTDGLLEGNMEGRRLGSAEGA